MDANAGEHKSHFRTKKTIAVNGSTQRISIQLSPPRVQILPIEKHLSIGPSMPILPLSTKHSTLASSQLSIIAHPAKLGSIVIPPKRNIRAKRASNFEYSTEHKVNYHSGREIQNDSNIIAKKVHAYKSYAKIQKGTHNPIHASMDMSENTKYESQPPKNEKSRVKLPEVKNFNITVNVKEASSFINSFHNLSNSTLSFPKVTFKEASTPYDIEEYEKFPMSAPYILTHKAKHLTSFEQVEVLSYKEIYYYGKKAEKIYASKMLDHNQGYDKEDGDYKIVMHDHVGYRYEIVSLLGEGSFGKVMKCYDHKDKAHVAVKIIKNKKRFNQQALIEVALLTSLNKSNYDGARYVVNLVDSFEFRNHIVMSLLVPYI